MTLLPSWSEILTWDRNSSKICQFDYSNNIGNNYISFKLFYKDRTNAINHYTFINDTGIIETRVANLGNIHELGIQMSGALKIQKAIAINPYIKLSEILTSPDNLAGQYDIVKKASYCFRIRVVSYCDFQIRYCCVVTISIYESQNWYPEFVFQRCSLFYFSWKNHSVSKIQNWDYQRSVRLLNCSLMRVRKSRAWIFYSRSEGDVRLSAVPVWLKFTYQFNSGEAIHKLNRTSEDVDNMPKKGF